MSKREDLEKLEREDLEEEARNTGVARPEVLTREEILDAIEALEERASGSREGSKGFLGRVRLVLAAFVERGLNLPEAAERIRAGTAAAPPEPAPMATVTLAEIYAAQGHTERALAVLDQILRAEPEHASALRLRARLRGQPVPPSADEDDEDDEETLTGTPPAIPAVNAPSSPTLVVLPPAPGLETATTPAPLASAAPVAPSKEAAPKGPPRPAPMLDEEPLPEHYEIDEIVLMPVDPTTLYLYWEIQAPLVDEARQLAPGGQLMLRLDQRVGERHRTLRLLPVTAIGDTQFSGLPAGAECVAILGIRTEFQWVPLLRSDPRALPPEAGVLEVARQVVQWREDKTVPAPPAEVPPALELAVAIQPAAALPAPAQTPRQEPEPEPEFSLGEPGPTSEWTRWLEAPVLPAEVPEGSSERPGPLGASERWQGWRRGPQGASERMIRGR